MEDLNSVVAEELKKIFKPDYLKLMYRGNFTKAQAALYMGIGLEKLEVLFNEGLGSVMIDGKETVPKAECDRFLNDRVMFKLPKKI